MIKIFILIFMMGCGPKYFQKISIPTESPCLDGVMVNIDNQTCSAFFWGYRRDTLKIRCGITSDQSWWVNTSFYFVPIKSQDKIHEEWTPYCTDKEFRAYTGPTLIKIGAHGPSEESGAGFNGDLHEIKKGEIVEANR